MCNGKNEEEIGKQNHFQIDSSYKSRWSENSELFFYTNSQRNNEPYNVYKPTYYIYNKHFCILFFVIWYFLRFKPF